MSKLIKTLAKAKRYTVADALTSAFQPSLGPAFCTLTKAQQFGIIINRPFSVKGTVTTLKGRYDEEIAMHLTNLILKRLCQNAIVDVEL